MHLLRPPPPASFAFAEPIGSGWQLVRHAPAGETWHPATDNLLGKDVYGTYVPNLDAPSAFSVAFQDMSFNEFLFMTGDQSVWLRAPSWSVYGTYTNEPRAVACSSGRAGSYQARWANQGHPFIGVMNTDRPTAGNAQGGLQPSTATDTDSLRNSEDIETDDMADSGTDVQYDGALLYAESSYSFDTKLLGLKGANVFIRFNAGEETFVPFFICPLLTLIEGISVWVLACG